MLHFDFALKLIKIHVHAVLYGVWTTDVFLWLLELNKEHYKFLSTNDNFDINFE
jgi:hypothetical protein